MNQKEAKKLEQKHCTILQKNKMDNISVFANLNTLPFATSICSYTPQYNYSSEEEEEKEGLQIFGREKKPSPTWAMQRREGAIAIIQTDSNGFRYLLPPARPPAL